MEGRDKGKIASVRFHFSVEVDLRSGVLFLTVGEGEKRMPNTITSLVAFFLIDYKTKESVSLPF